MGCRREAAVLKPRELKVQEVRAIFKKKGTNEQVGLFFDILPDRVGRIKRGEAYGQVTGKVYARQKKDRQELRRAVCDSFDNAALAARFAVSISTVKRYRAQEERMKAVKPLDQNTLEVLSGLEVLGKRVKITTQLDRKMYQKVNEVLEALGGKWSRAAAAHVFAEEPQDSIDEVLVTRELVRAPSLGWFATPAPLARTLVQMAEVEAGMFALEPSAGEGAIVGALLEAGAHVHAMEIDEGRRQTLLRRFPRPQTTLDVGQANFMYSMDDDQDRVVMNPPFVKVLGADHIDHVVHAMSMLKPGGILVSVLPASVSFRQDKRHQAFRAWYKRYGGKLTDLPEGSFKESGTSVHTVVLKAHR